jgi:hypothetical protein
MDIGDLSPEIKWLVLEADHSLPLVPMSRKLGSIQPLIHTPSWRVAYIFVVKYKDKFTISTFTMNSTNAKVTNRKLRTMK